MGLIVFNFNLCHTLDDSLRPHQNPIYIQYRTFNKKERKKVVISAMVSRALVLERGGVLERACGIYPLHAVIGGNITIVK